MDTTRWGSWRKGLTSFTRRLSQVWLHSDWKPSPRQLVLLLPLLLMLLPRNQPGINDSSWIKTPMPLKVRAVQARRVRVLLRRNARQVRVEHSQWQVPVVVRFDSRQVKARDLETGIKLASGNGQRIQPAPGRLLVVEGVPYRGAIEVFYDPQGRAVIVNELEIEDYLSGVVPLELGPLQFPFLEALKAQSAAARSYTLRHLGFFAHEGFDLYSDVRSQVYGGQGAEQELSNLAVLSTRGTVLLADSQPILAYFSSTCGGRTANFAEAFEQTEIHYLRGGIDCPDQASPYRDWELEFPIHEFLRRLDQEGAEINQITMTPFQNGRLSQLEVITPQERRTYTGHQARNLLVLRSTWITSLTRNGDRIRIQGHGFGHGVGLCQIGSVELARRGMTAEAILALYYPGTVLEKVY